jgi:hypothetical protein
MRLLAILAAVGSATAAKHCYDLATPVTTTAACRVVDFEMLLGRREIASYDQCCLDTIAPTGDVTLVEVTEGVTFTNFKTDQDAFVAARLVDGTAPIVEADNYRLVQVHVGGAPLLVSNAEWTSFARGQQTTRNPAKPADLLGFEFIDAQTTAAYDAAVALGATAAVVVQETQATRAFLTDQITFYRLQFTEGDQLYSLPILYNMIYNDVPNNEDEKGVYIMFPAAASTDMVPTIEGNGQGGQTDIQRAASFARLLGIPLAEPVGAYFDKFTKNKLRLKINFERGVPVANFNINVASYWTGADNQAAFGLSWLSDVTLVVAALAQPLNAVEKADPVPMNQAATIDTRLEAAPLINLAEYEARILGEEALQPARRWMNYARGVTALVSAPPPGFRAVGAAPVSMGLGVDVYTGMEFWRALHAILLQAAAVAGASDHPLIHLGLAANWMVSRFEDIPLFDRYPYLSTFVGNTAVGLETTGWLGAQLPRPLQAHSGAHAWCEAPELVTSCATGGGANTCLRAMAQNYVMLKKSDPHTSAGTAAVSFGLYDAMLTQCRIVNFELDWFSRITLQFSALKGGKNTVLVPPPCMRAINAFFDNLDLGSTAPDVCWKTQAQKNLYLSCPTVDCKNDYGDSALVPRFTPKTFLGLSREGEINSHWVGQTTTGDEVVAQQDSLTNSKADCCYEQCGPCRAGEHSEPSNHLFPQSSLMTIPPSYQSVGDPAYEANECCFPTTRCNEIGRINYGAEFVCPTKARGGEATFVAPKLIANGNTLAEYVDVYAAGFNTYNDVDLRERYLRSFHRQCCIEPIPAAPAWSSGAAAVGGTTVLATVAACAVVAAQPVL